MLMSPHASSSITKKEREQDQGRRVFQAQIYTLLAISSHPVPSPSSRSSASLAGKSFRARTSGSEDLKVLRGLRDGGRRADTDLSSHEHPIRPVAHAAVVLWMRECLPAAAKGRQRPPADDAAEADAHTEGHGDDAAARDGMAGEADQQSAEQHTLNGWMDGSLPVSLWMCVRCVSVQEVHGRLVSVLWACSTAGMSTEMDMVYSAHATSHTSPRTSTHICLDGWCAGGYTVEVNFEGERLPIKPQFYQDIKFCFETEDETA